MTTSELEKQIKTGCIYGVYLFYGENKFEMDSTLKKIKKTFGQLIQGINYISIYENNIENLLSEISTPAFGYDIKFIFVKNSNLFKKEAKTKATRLTDIQNEIKEYIENNINNINSYILLIFYEEKPEKNELYQTIEKYGNICNFENLKASNYLKKIKDLCNAYDVNISDNTVKKFVEIVGTDMQECINEIRKLIEYAGKGGIITDESVELLTIKKIEAVIFDLTDSLGKKDINKAMQVLEDLLYNKEPIQKILITLYNHFKKLYIISLALRYNKDVARMFKIKTKSGFFAW